MPAYLKNLKVKKVSFVDSPANKKPFVLTKAKDPITDVTNSGAIPEQTNEGVVNIMNEELRNQISELLKSDTPRNEVVSKLRESQEISDDLAKEINFFLDFVQEKVVEKEVEVEIEKKIADPEATELVKSLQSELQELKKAREIDQILKWMDSECEAYPGDKSETAEKIYKLQAVDPEAAKIMKDAIKTASDTTARAVLFSEVGKSIAEETNLGAEVAEKLKKAATDPEALKELEKSIASDPRAYEEYRATFAKVPAKS